MEPAIRVTNLGKRYRVTGAEKAPYRTLRESLTGLATAPLRRLMGRSTGAAEVSDFWALKDVSFEVQPGEVVGIIGRNGAGKSTLLKILSRITKPTTGRVEINGRVGSLLEVGTGFHPELSGRENVYLNGSILGMSRKEIDRKFDEIVAFAEIDKFLDTPVKRYSSGMYVRLAFAVAAHLEPEILIVDEVLAVGDSEFQKKCFAKVGEIGRQGRTVVVVSHDMTAIGSLCENGILLRKGRVYKSGSIRVVVADYLSDALATRDGAYEVSGHAGRSPNMSPLIQRVVLSGHDNRPTNRYCSLDRLTVEMHIYSPQRIENSRLAIAVEDHLGRRLFAVASHFTNAPPITLFGNTSVRCTIPELRLGTGRYLLSVSVATRQDGLLDSIDGCGWFDVESHDCYGNGEPYLTIYGPVLEKCSWSMT
jgi:lipopolysaccharide transport system ATP-binding protein